MLLRALPGKLKKLIAAEPTGCEKALSDPEPGTGGSFWGAGEWEGLVEGDVVVEA